MRTIEAYLFLFGDWRWGSCLYLPPLYLNQNQEVLQTTFYERIARKLVGLPRARKTIAKNLVYSVAHNKHYSRPFGSYSYPMVRSLI